MVRLEWNKIKACNVFSSSTVSHYNTTFSLICRYNKAISLVLKHYFDRIFVLNNEMKYFVSLRTFNFMK